MGEEGRAGGRRQKASGQAVGCLVEGRDVCRPKPRFGKTLRPVQDALDVRTQEVSRRPENAPHPNCTWDMGQTPGRV